MREARRLEIDHDTARVIWTPVELELNFENESSINHLYNVLSEIDVASVCQSGLNIYYQSDRSFLTAL